MIFLSLGKINRSKVMLITRSLGRNKLKSSYKHSAANSKNIIMNEVKQALITIISLLKYIVLRISTLFDKLVNPNIVDLENMNHIINPNNRCNE